jgi:hypothetical protein
LEEEMPDLGQLFGALQSDADLVPSADVSVIRALGRRRRIRQTASGVVAVGLVVAAVVAGPALSPTAKRSPVDTPAGVTFAPLRTVGGEDITYGAEAPGSLQVVTTTVADGRGYVLWQSDHGVAKAAAVDLGTGRRLWGPVTVDASDGWMAIYAAPQAVAVIAASDAGAARMTVLDPRTGDKTWQRQLGVFDGLAYDSAIVLADHSTGTTEAVDWRTGETLWTVTDPSGSLVSVLGMRVSNDLSQPGSNLPYSDPRLVEVGGDRTVRVYDVLSGQLLGTRAALGNEVLAYNGTVFSIRDSTATVPNQVLAYDVLRTDVPRVVYQSPHGSPRLRAVVPCGTRRICLVEGYGTNNGADAEVVAVDLDARASVWRVRSGDLDALVPMGDRVLGRAGDGLTGIYGADHSTVLVPRGSAGYADRVDSGSVLMLRPASDETQQAANDTYVVGVSVATGEQIALGRIEVWPSSCSWDLRYLLCGTATGFQVWRFTAT